MRERKCSGNFCVADSVMTHRICFKTKGNHKQGMGDVTGSIALAKELKNRGQSLQFLLDDDVEAINAVREAAFDFTLLYSMEKALGEGILFDIMIVNQLNTDFAELKVLKEHCRLLVTIDDIGEGSRNLADLRINPLYYDDDALCGPKYVPLHFEFQNARESKKLISERPEHILVTLGGSDTYGFTPKVIEALLDYAIDREVTVITGPAFKHHDILDAVLSRRPEAGFNILHAVSVSTMRKSIEWADVAVCAAGNSLFEMACLGTPSVVVCAEPFEEETAYRMNGFGFGMVVPFNMEPDVRKVKVLLNELEDRGVRRAHSENGRRLVDGRGVERMADKILEAGKVK